MSKARVEVVIIQKLKPRFFPTRGGRFFPEKGLPFLYRSRQCQTGYNLRIIKIVVVDLSMLGGDS